MIVIAVIRRAESSSGVCVAKSAEATQLIMSASRTVLAVERTYAAWVRTGLACLAAGVASREFIRSAAPFPIAGILASLLILFSGFCFFAAAWRELSPLTSSRSADVPRIAPAISVGANTLMVSISAITLIGLWTETPLANIGFCGKHVFVRNISNRALIHGY